LEQCKFTAQFATAKTLTGTRSHHCFISTAEDELKKIFVEQMITRMWANAQRDGRPAEHSWRPLFNAAKFS